MDTSPKKICGAKNRQGQPCQKRPLKGKSRCKNHGGATPTARHTGNKKHGLYSAHLTPEEQAQWGGIQLGAVDDELRLLRIYLNRCVALDAEISKDPNSTSNSVSMELTEVRRSKRPDGDTLDVTSRRPDVMGRMNWIVGRIALLEKTRAELVAAAKESGDGIDDVARDLVNTMRAMRRTEFGPTDE